MKPRYAAALALMFISVGCLPFEININSDPNVHPGWKCPQGISPVSLTPTPPCAWIGANASESCRQQMTDVL
jgi:hypothetical protein